MAAPQDRNESMQERYDREDINAELVLYRLNRLEALQNEGNGKLSEMQGSIAKMEMRLGQYQAAAKTLIWAAGIVGAALGFVFDLAYRVLGK